MTPDDRRFTREHEWILAQPDGTLRIGITDYAQDALGDVVFVALPEVGAAVTAGQPCGEVESTKTLTKGEASRLIDLLETGEVHDAELLPEADQ